jgi:alginate O-acetyltransferase complex protein AlgI
MLFNSITYLVFFPIVFALYWCARERFRIPILLIASYLFYMSWIPAYAILLLVLTIANYVLGMALAKFHHAAKGVLTLGLLLNLGVLCFYKYANFFLQSIEQALKISVLTPVAAASQMPAVNVILPLGISFFVFEFIHYLVDIYRGSAPISNFLNFGLFAAFFPSQIAGPIKRYGDFVEQLQRKDRLSATEFHRGLQLLLQGLFKKSAISDNLAPLVMTGFQQTQNLSTIDAWVAALAFALQIYFDFSGYTDMGRGSAILLGFQLPDNFNFPYLAASLTDFWKRWHISLSTWLRDYLYIPLGGGRGHWVRKSRNLMITMLLGGLWHGAAWHYVIWGGFHGLGLIINHSYDALVARIDSLKRFHASPPAKLFCAVMTFLFVLVGWVLFRAESLPQAGTFLQSLCGLASLTHSSELPAVFWHSPLPVILAAYSTYALLSRYGGQLAALTKVSSQWLSPARIAVYVGTFIAVLGFAPSQSNPFIYFQF